MKYIPLLIFLTFTLFGMKVEREHFQWDEKAFAKHLSFYHGSLGLTEKEREEEVAQTTRRIMEQAKQEEQKRCEDEHRKQAALKKISSDGSQ